MAPLALLIFSALCLVSAARGQMPASALFEQELGGWMQSFEKSDLARTPREMHPKSSVRAWWDDAVLEARDPLRVGWLDMRECANCIAGVTPAKRFGLISTRERRPERLVSSNR